MVLNQQSSKYLYGGTKQPMQSIRVKQTYKLKVYKNWKQIVLEKG
nr:hypothetical protein [Enterococcus faecium]